MTKKLLALNLAIIMIIGMLPFTASAASDNSYGYGVFYKNDGSDDYIERNIPNFLTSNANLMLYRIMPDEFEADGKVLVGFNSRANGSGTTYSLTSVIGDYFSTISSRPTKFYAMWEPVNGDYVRYICPGGRTAGGKDYYIDGGKNGSAILKSGDIFTASDGKRVLNWCDVRYDYDFGEEIEIENGIGTTVYADVGYNRIKFNFKYNGNEGIGDYYTILNYYNENDTLSWNADFSDIGCFWSGWNSNEYGTGVWYHYNSLAKNVPSVLYATYDEYPDGEWYALITTVGLVDGRDQHMVEYTSNDHNAILPFNLTGRYKAAYWYDYQDKIYPSGVQTVVEPYYFLYAVETADNVYNAIFNGNGGEAVNGGEYDAYTYDTESDYTYGDYPVAETMLEACRITKEGHRISGFIGSKTKTIYAPDFNLNTAFRTERDDYNLANFTVVWECVDHSFSAWHTTESPTCTKTGTEERTCVNCEYVETRMVPETGHSFGAWTVVTPAGFHTDGLEKHICSVCGQEETRVIPKLSDSHTHNFNGEEVIALAPTCTEDGTKRIYCYESECGEYKEEVIAATGHTLGEWFVDVSPTCTENGIEKRTCQNCDYSETRSIPATGHSFGDWFVATPAGFHTNGLEKRICSVCGEEETRVIPELSDSHTHDFSGKEEITLTPTCTETGTNRIFCYEPECGEYIEEAIAATGHTLGEWEIKTAPTYTTEGERIKKCLVCGEELESEILPIVSRDPDTIIGISVISNPDKTIYNFGDDLNTTGAVISVLFSDLTYQSYPVSGDMISGYDKKSAGLQEITVNYEGKTDVFFINVLSKYNFNPSDWEYSTRSDGTLSITAYKGSSSNVTIPDKINGINVTSIAAEAFRGNSIINRVVIPDGITIIGQNAFYNCSNLVEVIFPNTLTNISDYAFMYCTSLTQLLLPSSLNNIGDNAFRNCTSLKLVFMPNIDDLGLNAFYKAPVTALCLNNSNTKNMLGRQGIDYKVISANPTVTGISLKSSLAKLTHIQGEELVTDGAKITVTCTNGFSYNLNITSDMVSGYDKLVTGEQTITVNYEGFECYFDIIVEHVHDYNEWNIRTTPTCLLSGLAYRVCIACEADETVVIPAFAHNVTEWKTIIPATYVSQGTKQKICTLCGDVLDEETIPELVPTSENITGISMNALPNKTSYTEGDALDLTGGIIKVTYDDRTSEEFPLVDDYVSGFDTGQGGKQTITVSYKGKTTTFEIELTLLYTLGDVNEDDSIDAKDVLRLRRWLAKDWPSPDNTLNESAADTNGDGSVNAKDVLRLRRVLARDWPPPDDRLG